MEELYELYELTAKGWVAFPDPATFAQAAKGIHTFASTGAPDEVLQMCDRLLCNNNNPKLHNSGLNLLLHLVSKRWGDLSDQNKETIFSALPRLMANAAKVDDWSSKNKTGMLVSHLIGEEDTGAWAKLVAASTAFLSCDDVMAERTIITCISEAITIPNDGSRDKTSKALKIQNWDWLLEKLFSLLNKYLKNFDSSQVAAAQQHYDLALCIANTAAAYAQWGEVKNLVKGAGGMDLINSCKVLLGYDAFFPAAFAYLSQICLRVQSTDCDHGVLMDLFHLFFDILSLPLDPLHVAFGARKTICLSLVSVKEALGPDFEPHREGVICSLEKMKANGSITNMEYDQLREKLVMP